ncbi:MAG TPA: alternative ribosome rescue aminoacyl-tRNA hydrolase ArfB [Actinomycetota bacterium]|nr:alternative ribosome rescue aminoacyl-tRNA hydrolase ArfB [Actinomycetota bacterium]
MDDLRVGRGAVIPASEVAVKFSRSGGPGGQNVNKRDTRVEVSFDVKTSPSLSPTLRRRALTRLRGRLDASGRLRVVSSVERTQARNRERAVEILRQQLEDALRPPPPPRVATKPTRSAREQRLESKRRRSRTKRQRAKPDED